MIHKPNAPKNHEDLPIEARKMIYQIKVIDFNSDTNEPSIYLNALIEDLSEIHAISNIKFTSNEISLETNFSEID